MLRSRREAGVIRPRARDVGRVRGIWIVEFVGKDLARLDRSLFESNPLQANTKSVKICESASSTLPPPKLLLRPGIDDGGTKLWKLVIGYSLSAVTEAPTTASVNGEAGV